METCEGDWMEKVGSERYRPHKGGAGDRPRTLINPGTGKQWNWDLMKWGLSKVIRGLDAALKRLAPYSFFFSFLVSGELVGFTLMPSTTICCLAQSNSQLIMG